MARWSLPIPVLDPLYDLQVLAWRRTFDFGWSREREPADAASLPPPLQGNPTTRSPRLEAQEGASRDGNRG